MHVRAVVNGPLWHYAYFNFSLRSEKVDEDVKDVFWTTVSLKV